MKIGVFNVLFNGEPLEDALKRVSALGLEAVELGAGGYSASTHMDVAALLESRRERDELLGLFERYGLTISALSAHGNPVHPDPDIAALHHAQFEQTVRLAAQLGVERVLLLSGCLGGAPGDRVPNWITCPWPTTTCAPTSISGTTC